MNTALTLHDRISGCLLGGACGDALGVPVEFMSGKDIRSRYGPNGITESDRAYRVLGSITDDTQMTLFTVVLGVEVLSDGRRFCTALAHRAADALLGATRS
jgi:ADP-ribosylglycohydrolase